MLRNLLAASVLVALGSFVVAAELKSGPQAGTTLPGPFHPLNINGDSAGEKACLYCKHGDSPVAMVFARCAECPMTQKLIEKLDAVTAKNKGCEMGSFAVFLSDDDKMGEALKTMAEKKGLKNITLAIDNPAGPTKYNINKDADITVVLYTDRVVKVNMSFEKGKLTDKDIDAIVSSVSKIVPAK